MLRFCGKTSNGDADENHIMSMDGRSKLQPVDAYAGEHSMIYADIVPKHAASNSDKSNSEQLPKDEPHQVIYAELAAIPSPVVNVDNEDNSE